MAYNMPSRASQLLRQLSAADFYAQDLKLFLDTHPDDEKALELYREAVKQTEACRCAGEIGNGAFGTEARAVLL